VPTAGKSGISRATAPSLKGSDAQTTWNNPHYWDGILTPSNPGVNRKRQAAATSKPPRTAHRTPGLTCQNAPAANYSNNCPNGPVPTAASALRTRPRSNQAITTTVSEGQAEELEASAYTEVVFSYIVLYAVAWAVKLGV
jgi:hypothetical protein